MTARPILSATHYAYFTALFSVFVIYGSLVPLEYVACSFRDALTRYTDALTKPLSFASRSDWAANVLLFIPLGFVALGMLAVDRPRQPWHLVLIPVFAVFSAFIEFLQLWFPARTTSINDVVAETLGGLIGMGVWAVLGTPLTQRVRAAWMNLETGDWAAKLLPLYLFVLIFAHGMPFDLSISPGEIWQKYQRGFNAEVVASGAPIIALMPTQATLPEKVLLCVVYFVPLGFLLARLPSPRWRGREALGRVLGAGLLIAAGIEGLQLIVLSAGCYASDIVGGVLAVVAGWKLATLAVIPPRTPILALGVWCAALVAVRWTPLATAERAFNWIPFADYYASNYLASFNRILHVTVLFMPVGFFLPAWRQRLVLAAVGGAGYAAFIEIGQLSLTAHTASISDVILGSVGTLCGAVLRSRLPTSVPVVKLTAKPQAAPKIVFYTGLR